MWIKVPTVQSSFSTLPVPDVLGWSHFSQSARSYPASASWSILALYPINPSFAWIPMIFVIAAIRNLERLV
jgi:hypothetical protein